MTLEAGQIVLLPFPHTNQRSGKKRPALVVTPAQYNDQSPDVILAYVTSRRQTGPWSLAITTKDLESGKLIKPSWIRVDRLATVEQALIQSTVGMLNPAVAHEVSGRLASLFA